MRIISMCTYSYKDWIHTFYHSIKEFNPDANITIYLINFPEEKRYYVEGAFPDVDFKVRDGSFELKETYNLDNKSYKVTFLKGELMSKSLEDYEEDCLWIDITSLIRSDLSDVFKELGTHDAALIKRDKDVDRGPRAYAAEIFGLSHRAKGVYKSYERVCNQNKKAWYADQMSLCSLPTKNVYYMPFGPFCNFFYEEDARTWSDRGKEGKGTLTHEDEDYTVKKYVSEMSKYLRMYAVNRKKYLDGFGKMLPKILVFLDDIKWCYATTTHALITRLSKYYDFTVIRTIELDRDKAKRWKGDFIFSRCGAYRAVKILALKPEYKNRIVTCFTTGNDNAMGVVERNGNLMDEHLGVFTQNSHTEKLLKETYPDLDVFFIPNGVDINKFKPNDIENHGLVVGFAGRRADEHADKSKGYNDYYVTACERFGARRKVCDSGMNFVPHDKMPDFYNSVHLMLQPSSHEGCSNTVMEAMSSGIPCLITKTGYHGEICKDKKNVVFVERDVDDIIKKMEWITNPKNYLKVSEGARAFAELHSWDDIAKRYKKIFDKLVKKVNTKLYKS